MSEYKAGDKVLVPFEVLSIDESGEYPFYIGYGTARIHASAEMLERFRQAAGGENSNKTYEDGLQEAWETARKIAVDKVDGGLSREETERIFGNYYFTADVFDNYTPQEAAAKIAEWEGKREIRVGDVVKDSTLKSGYAVVSYLGEDSMCCVVWDDGSCGTHDKNNFVKTGRTIDIAGLLAQIGGAEQ